MSRSREQRERKPSTPSLLDDARNELFSHIHRCGVLRATPEQQVEWMQETVEFVGERFSGLSPEQLEELKAIGLRFCQPVIANRSESEPESETAAA